MTYINVRAIPGNVSKKGEVVNVSDTAIFGRSARLPKVLRVEVTGATAEQIDHLLNRLKGAVTYTIVSENVNGWRARMEIDPAVIAATGDPGEFKQSIKDYILGEHEGNWVATLHAQTSTSITVDIAKGQTYDLPEIKADVDAVFVDTLQQTYHFQRYYFPDAVVDPRVTQGLIDEAAAELPDGFLPVDWTHFSITKAQALASIVDRLA